MTGIMKQRTAGTLAVALAAAVAILTLGHLVYAVWLIGTNRLAESFFEFDDGVLIYTELANPAGVTALADVAAIIADLTILAVAALVVIIGLSLIHGRPFNRRMPLAVTLVGIAIAVGGTISEVLGAIGRHAPTSRVEPGNPLDLAVGYFSVSLLPLAAGLAIVVLAVVFRHGSQMQRDTEGLV